MSEQNNYTSPNSNVNDSLTNEELSTPTIFGYNGRIGRLRYIAYTVIGLFAFYFSLIIPAVFIAISPVIAGLLMFVMVVVFMVLAFSWPIRRLHDLDHSGWLVLLQFIPLVNIAFALYIIFAPGTVGNNKFGAQPIPNSTGVIIAAAVVPVIIIATIGILAAVAIPAYNDYLEKVQALEVEIQQDQN